MQYKTIAMRDLQHKVVPDTMGTRDAASVVEIKVDAFKYHLKMKHVEPDQKIGHCLVFNLDTVLAFKHWYWNVCRRPRRIDKSTGEIS